MPNLGVNLPRIKFSSVEISLMVHWLRLHTFTAGRPSLIPGQGTKTPQAACQNFFFIFFFLTSIATGSAVWLQQYLTSVVFNFLIYEMGLIIIPTLSGKLWEKIRWDGAEMPAVH